MGWPPWRPRPAGLPVVAGRSGGVPDIVAEGVSGLLTPPGDATAFADAVRALLNDGQRRRAMGDAAADWVAGALDLGAAAETLGRIVAGFEASS